MKEGTPKITVDTFDNTEIEKAHADLQEAIESKDDEKLNSALGEMKKALDTVMDDKNPDDEEETKKADPFEAKVAKYAPTQGE